MHLKGNFKIYKYHASKYLPAVFSCRSGMKRTFTVEEAVQLVTEDSDDEELDDVHLVVLPPEVGNQNVSDEEDIDEEDLLPSEIRDVPGFIEIHRTADNSFQQTNLKKEKKICPNWQKDADLSSDVRYDESNTIEDTFPLLIDKTPIELFRLFFYSDVVDLCTNQTNLYAHQHLEHGFNITKNEMETFLAIILLSGYHILPQQHLYWCTDEDVGVPCVSQKMSKNRFKEIKRFFHLADNSNLCKNDKMAKLRPFMQLFLKNLQQFGIFSSTLSLDEQMIPYYGRNNSKMYMKGKPVKFGYKLFVLASSSGYPFNFDLYTGAKVDPTVPLGESVVSILTECMEKEKHVLYMDRFFSSTKSFRKFGQERLRCTGTALESRIEKCPILTKNAMKKLPRGTHAKFSDGEVLVCQWNDSRPVVIISNFESVEPVHSGSRWSKSDKKRITLPIPHLVHNYNQHMGGVDLLDRFLSDYRPKLRNKKWWWNIFANFLNMAVVAAWRLHRDLKGDMPHLPFRR